MTKKTGYLVGGLLVVGILIYLLTRTAKVGAGTNAGNSTVGSGASTTNAALGFGTAVVGFLGKILPGAASAASNGRPDVADMTTAASTGSVDYVDLGATPGDITPNAAASGQGAFDIGTG
jgi:hypothetical protein